MHKFYVYRHILESKNKLRDKLYRNMHILADPFGVARANRQSGVAAILLLLDKISKNGTTYIENMIIIVLGFCEMSDFRMR